VGFSVEDEGKYELLGSKYKLDECGRVRFFQCWFDIHEAGVFIAIRVKLSKY